jgi:hypothetical protein
MKLEKLALWSVGKLGKVWHRLRNLQSPRDFLTCGWIAKHCPLSPQPSLAGVSGLLAKQADLGQEMRADMEVPEMMHVKQC